MAWLRSAAFMAGAFKGVNALTQRGDYIPPADGEAEAIARKGKGGLPPRVDEVARRVAEETRARGCPEAWELLWLRGTSP